MGAGLQAIAFALWTQIFTRAVGKTVFWKVLPYAASTSESPLSTQSGRSKLQGFDTDTQVFELCASNITGEVDRETVRTTVIRRVSCTQIVHPRSALVSIRRNQAVALSRDTASKRLFACTIIAWVRRNRLGPCTPNSKS